MDARLRTLARTPGFGSFPSAELAILADLFSEEHFGAGEIVCREGEEGDRLFVVVSGSLEVRSGPDERLLRTLGPGDLVGEVSLLLGGRRTASVVASETSRLLSLDRASFERRFKHNAKVLEYLSRVLSKRLMSSPVEGSGRRITLIAVTGDAALTGRSTVAHALARFLGEFSGHRAVLVTVQPDASRDRGAVSLEALLSGPVDETQSRLKPEGRRLARLETTLEGVDPGATFTSALRSLVERLREDAAFVVLDLPRSRPDASAAAEEAAHVVVRLVRSAVPGPPARGRGGRTLYEVLNLHNVGCEPIPVSHSEPFVLPRDTSLARRDAAAGARHLFDQALSPASPPLRRLARRILGTSVGLALGGGAAFGIAHVGVLQVLEENGIPMDVLTGTSMGSLVAMAYARGTRPFEMAEFAENVGLRRALSVLDWNRLEPGLIGGRRITRVFAPMIPEETTFEGLLFPCRAVATDVERGERVSMGDGDVPSALRASCSVPLIIAPTRRGERLLVDGVMVDPVPAEVAHEMGADVCIAVNVIPRPQKGVSTALTRMTRAVSRLNPLSQLSRLNPFGGGSSGDIEGLNIFDLYMNALQAEWHELGTFRSLSADVRINPDLTGFTWTDVHRGTEIIERGTAAAADAIEPIRAALAERCEAALS